MLAEKHSITTTSKQFRQVQAASETACNKYHKPDPHRPTVKKDVKLQRIIKGEACGYTCCDLRLKPSPFLNAQNSS